jgi:heme exporter protein B
MATKSSGSVRRALAVFYKDIKSELRTRYAINAILLFAVVTVFAVSFAMAKSGGMIEPVLQASLLWIVIYFSSLSGLAQSFVKEEESRTATALRLYAPAGSVFGGKLLFNLALLIVMILITIPLFAVFLDLNVANYPLFFSIIILGSLGMVGTTTMVAAIISKASVKGALFAVLSFPLLLPVLMMAISGTKKSFTPDVAFAAARMEIQVLGSYLVVMIILGFLLFDSVWND